MTSRQKTETARQALPAGTSDEDAGAVRGHAEFLDRLAESICERGFGTVAMFLLESVRPLNFLGSQVLYALGPIASVFVDSRKWEGFAEALEDRSTIDRLIRTIEAREAASSPKN